MNRLLSITLSCLFVAELGTSLVNAMGADHSREQIVSRGATCVHGYWVNSSDVFFHQGNANEFNRFVTELAKTQGSQLLVVLHPGGLKVQSPWATTYRNVPADWSVTTGPMARRTPTDRGGDLLQIDLWLGGRVKFEAVRFPSNVEIIRMGGVGEGSSDRAPQKD